MTTEPPDPRLADLATNATSASKAALVVGFALVIQTLNATVVFNALPAMAFTFGVDPLRLNVLVTVYMLAAGVCLPLSGWLADRLGARRVFLGAMALYTAASLACGLAADLEQMILARALQGATGAAMLPIGRLILLRTTPKGGVVGALAIMTVPASLGPMIGPVIGGAIVSFADWRWIFLMNLPIAVLGSWFVWRWVPAVEKQPPRPLDLMGCALTGVGLGSLIFAFDALGRDHPSAVNVVSYAAVGVISLAAYGWHAGRTPNPVIDLSILRYRSYAAAVIGGLFVRLASGALPFLLTLLFQVAFGLSAFRAGLMVAAPGAAALLMRVVAPPVLRWFGLKRVLIANSIFVCASLSATALISQTWPGWLTVGLLAACGFIHALQYTALNGLAYADIEPERMSAAATTAAMMQQFAQSAGVGVAATLLQLLVSRAHLDPTTGLRVTLVALGTTTAVSAVWFLRLQDGVGSELTGEQPQKRS